jgi:hypothetical protein
MHHRVLGKKNTETKKKKKLFSKVEGQLLDVPVLPPTLLK